MSLADPTVLRHNLGPPLGNFGRIIYAFDGLFPLR